MGFKSSHITILLYSLLALFAFTFLAFEWTQLQSNSATNDINFLATQSVDLAFESFQDEIFAFSSNSTSYANEVEKLVIPDPDFASTTVTDEGFWGAIVYEEQEPIYWSGYSSTLPLDSILAANSEILLQRVRDGNIHYVESTIPFLKIQDADSTNYQVITKLLLAPQNSIINESLQRKVHLNIFSKEQFPARITYSRVNPDSTIHQKEFVSISGDLIATIYSTEKDTQRYVNLIEQHVRMLRTEFILGIVILFSLLIVWVSRNVQAYLSLFIRVGLVNLIYFLLHPFIETISTSTFISDLTVFSFLVVLFTCFYLLHRQRINKIGQSTSEIYLLSFFSGLLFSTICLYLFQSIYQTVSETNLNLFNQVLTSSILTSLWIWAVGFSFLILIVQFNYLILMGSENENKRNWAIIIASYAGALIPVSVSLFLISELSLDRIIILVSFGLISALLLISFFQLRFYLMRYKTSLLRVLLVINILVGIAATTTIYYSFDENLSKELINESVEFEFNNEDRVQAVITDLLFEAYNDVRSISLFSVSNFEQIIENLLQEDWLRYSFSVQLIDRNGSPLAAYNTDLSVPQWTTEYRIDELIIPYEEERIRRDNIRPILRNRPINTINAEYSYFMRGWIPVYQSNRSENISGWILATLYQEVPEINRPFRSVVNATIQSPEETAFSITEYVNGVPTRNEVSGTLTSIPDYGVLPKSIEQKLKQNSTIFQSTRLQNLDLKESFSLTEEASVIRAAHLKITIPQILYVFLRIYFTVAIPFILMLILILGSSKLSRFTESRKIRDRLMDRSIIASIVCLFVLISATTYILENQNRREVQDTLRDQLVTLTETLEEATDSEQTSIEYLENITSVIGVDASVFNQGLLTISTTPPIYTQHLIPETVPWIIYQEIVNNGAQLALDILNIGEQELMIGYQPWFNSDGNISGIVAIPTFLKTPDFYSRLVSTTSYLLAIYSLIFVILIISIGFISTRITSPLEKLEEGLKKISGGDLDTRLKIYSNDEIGMLTIAYNSMADQLKKLQSELALTEREAAWKQMAQQVAHEIKNPLTPMKLNLQHLERQLSKTGEELSIDKPKISAIANSMIEQIEALNKIASDFSKFAKPTNQQFEEIKVNQLISSVTAMYNEGDSRISTHFDNREFIISGVQDELRRAFVNLIKNALEAIDSNGEIQLKTVWNKSTKSVDIVISDNGIGIPEKEAESIFLPNFSTKTSGTGLGLAITKKIIEEHLGSIQFKSEKGKGTSFIISLPLKNS